MPFAHILRAAARLPRRAVQEVLRAAEDIRAIQDNDPAARSGWEVALVYPGLHALWMHRVAHAMWSDGIQFPARLLAHTSRFITGVEIHPAAKIGHSVVIDHGMGVVIGETAEIGDGCLIYKGVVLGGTTLTPTKRHPTLGKNVVVGSNACILGAIEIGDGARVGSGSVVVKAVPAGATVVGVPARVVTPKDESSQPHLHHHDAALDHANLPDPVMATVKACADENKVLRERIQAMEQKLTLTRGANGHGKSNGGK